MKDNTQDPAGVQPAPDPERPAQQVDQQEDYASTGDNVPPPPPNGGYGWVCCACVCIINAHTWGLNSSYAVFLAHYLQTDAFPGATALEYAFVGSLSISCALLISPLATIGVREMGSKPTMMLGVILEAGSLIGASFAHEIWQLFLSQGILFGVGMGFLFVASVPIVPQWFTTRRSLANGISTCGSGLGGLIYSFGTGAMISNLGLEWAFRILGIVAFVVNTICVILLRDRNRIIGASALAFDLSLFRRPEYLLLLGYGWFSMLSYVALVFSLANYANEIGLGASEAALVSAFFNMGQAIGRPLIGYFSDRTGRISMASLMTLLAGVFSLAIWIPADVYGVLIFFSIVGGAVGGTFWVTVTPVTAEIVGLRHVASGLNILWLTIVLPCVFSEPIALQMVTGTGSYLGTQILVGLCFVAAAICCAGMRGWKVGEIDEVCRLTGKDRADIDPEKVAYNDDLSARAKAAGRKRMLVDFWKWSKV